MNILPIVEISHLRKEYGAVIAVRDITLNIATGELFGLLGPNGSGKTTMIRPSHRAPPQCHAL